MRLNFLAPSRGLIGYYSEFLSDTRGTGLMNRLFHGYAPYKGPIAARRTGVLISNGAGEAVAYAMWKLEDRGPMIIVPGMKVYEGMIIGEHSKSNDLDVNVLEGKKLTNIAHDRQGRSRSPDAADADGARESAGLYRG